MAKIRTEQEDGEFYLVVGPRNPSAAGGRVIPHVLQLTNFRKNVAWPTLFCPASTLVWPQPARRVAWRGVDG